MGFRFTASWQTTKQARTCLACFVVFVGLASGQRERSRRSSRVTRHHDAIRSGVWSHKRDASVQALAAVIVVRERPTLSIFDPKPHVKVVRSARAGAIELNSLTGRQIRRVDDRMATLTNPIQRMAFRQRSMLSDPRGIRRRRILRSSIDAVAPRHRIRRRFRPAGVIARIVSLAETPRDAGGRGVIRIVSIIFVTRGLSENGRNDSAQQDRDRQGQILESTHDSDSYR